MEEDDPVDWSIDRVVQEICHAQTPSWATGLELKPLTCPEAVAKAFRENDIDGDNLLALEDKDLRTDIGISSFGQRRTLRKLIQHLRSLSLKYQTHFSHLTTTNLATPQPSHASITSVGRSPSYVASSIQTLIENARVNGFAPVNVENESLAQGIGVNVRKRKHQESEDTSHSVNDRAVRKLEYPKLNSPNGAIIPANEAPLKISTHTSLEPSGVSNRVVGADSDTLGDLSQYFLDSVESAIDQELNTVNELNNNKPVDRLNGSEPRSPRPKNVQPHRRGVLIPVTDEAASQLRAVNAMFTKGGSSMPDSFEQAPEGNNSSMPALSVASKPIKTRPRYVKPDQILSDKADKGTQRSELSGPDSGTSFFFAGPALPTGRMRRGIFKPKFTFQPQQPITPATKPVTSSSKQKATSSWEIDNPYAELPAHLLDILYRNPTDHNQQEFPPYLESDEEDIVWDADSDTSPQDNNVKEVTLSRDEIDTIVDNALEQFRADWRVRSLPKVQVKAHKKWMIAAKEKFLRASMLQENRRLMEMFSNQIRQQRNGIHLSKWRKAEDVEQQCLASEMSLHQLEEYKLYVDVLTSEIEPPLPTRTTLVKSQKSRQRTVMANGDEELGSDDADSFIIDDQLPLPVGDDSTWNPVFAAKDENTIPNTTTLSCDPDQVVDSVEQPEYLPDPTHEGVHVSGRAAASSGATELDQSQMKSTTNGVAAKAIHRNPLVLPHSTDSEADSDFERPFRIPNTKYREQGVSKNRVIDLTRSSSPSGSARHSSFEIRTPDLNEIDSDPKNWTQRKSTSVPRLVLRCGSKPRSPNRSSLIYDVHRVRSMAWSDVAPTKELQSPDCRLVLAKTIYSLEKKEACRLLDYLKAVFRDEDLADVLLNGLFALKEAEEEIADVEKKNQRNAMLLTELFVCFAIGVQLDMDFEATEEDIDEAHQLLQTSLPDFRHLLASLLQNLLNVIETKQRSNYVSTDDASGDADTEIDDFGMQGPSRKRRKRKVDQDQAVLSQQVYDQNKAKMQEARRALILQEQALRGHPQGGLSIPISISEPLVYLDPKLAACVKPHQQRGIEFMWREIVENKRSEGCLLAHTMGLGKTMQVISLLACIAQCNASRDPSMRQHIPRHLQRFRILILCPFAIVENWYEELQRWLPDPLMLGVLVKMDNAIRHPETTAQGWFDRGGVLIMTYERFRLFVMPPSRQVETDPEGVKRRQRLLLEGPDIVIADEAHKLKNAQSKINQAASQILTKTRIALTGSPLNNHLEEYHTMIDWISPGYLGSMVQFRARYVEPISRGLYAESTSFERKISMKRLHMLKRTIEPKIHRADISAISKDLPPKVEFFLTLALTEEQKAAYRIYVQHLRKSSSSVNSGKLDNTSLWNWLGVLSLLLNHPSCFVNKIKQTDDSRAEAQAQAQAKAAARAMRGESDDDEYGGVVENAVESMDLRQNPILENAMQRVLDVFEQAKIINRMEDPTLSNKSLLIKLIIQEATKHNEKTLIFSKSIPTLDYYQSMITQMGLGFKRIDGSCTVAGGRQKDVAEFNTMDVFKVFLISTRAGGLGLNIQSGTRVIINDFDFNPTWEQQAIGRAYRIGQKQPVFVYRFLVGGTFEELIHNKTVFKTQLFTRVVDEKNVISQAVKRPGEFLFDPREIPQSNFNDCLGKDPKVLDRVLEKVDCVRNIFLTETFFQDDGEQLDESEIHEADKMLAMEQLERDDPDEYHRQEAARQKLATEKAQLRKMQGPSGGTLSFQTSFVPSNSQSKSHILDIRPITNQVLQPSQHYSPYQPNQSNQMFHTTTRSAPNLHLNPMPRSRSSFDDTYVNLATTNFPSHADWNRANTSMFADDYSMNQSYRPAPLNNPAMMVSDTRQQRSPYFQASDFDVATETPVIGGHTNRGGLFSRSAMDNTTMRYQTAPSSFLQEHASNQISNMPNMPNNDLMMNDEVVEDPNEASGCRPQ